MEDDELVGVCNAFTSDISLNFSLVNLRKIVINHINYTLWVSTESFWATFVLKSVTVKSMEYVLDLQNL